MTVCWAGFLVATYDSRRQFLMLLLHFSAAVNGESQCGMGRLISSVPEGWMTGCMVEFS